MSLLNTFDLSKFEQLVSNREYENAENHLLALLEVLRNNTRIGSWSHGQVLDAQDVLSRTSLEPFATRAAQATIALFSDPHYVLSAAGCLRFLHAHWTLATLFAASAEGNADRALRIFGGTESGQLMFTGNAVFKFAVLHSLESELPWQPEMVWAAYPQLAAAHFLALCCSPISASRTASDKREAIIRWLPTRLDDIDLHESTFAFLHTPWMYCSYALCDDKHLLKAALNRQMRKALLARGYDDSALPSPRPIRDRPVILAVIERFGSGSAMYRCFQPSIAALRRHFRVYAIAREGYMDAVAENQFDDIRYLSGSGGLIDVMREAFDYVREIQPDIVFYPSLGMMDFSVAMANLRLAPIQMISGGHPATSMAPNIDYFVTEEGFMGATDCFSEQVLLLPGRSMPWTLPQGPARVPPEIRAFPNPVRVAVTASAMKLNADFLDICRRIADRTNVPLEFHFFVGVVGGLASAHVWKGIGETVCEPVVHEHTAYDSYIRELNRCDLYLDPIPFGNTNGIVDAVRQYIPGVCLDGRELHSRIGAEISRRLGLPSWLIANSIDEYVAAAARLATDTTCRIEISELLRRGDPDQVFFTGAPQQFADGIHWLYCNHESVKRSGQKVVRPPGLAAGNSASGPHA